MSRMEIKKMTNKTKILMEYPTKIGVGFVALYPKDLDKLVVNVFLKDGRRIVHEEIKQITLKVRGK